MFDVLLPEKNPYEIGICWLDLSVSLGVISF
jgi:hypothetical protein